MLLSRLCIYAQDCIAAQAPTAGTDNSNSSGSNNNTGRSSSSGTVVADALFSFAAVEGLDKKKNNNGESPDDDVVDDVSDDLQQVWLCMVVYYTKYSTIRTAFLRMHLLARMHYIPIDNIAIAV
jgi:hypothetical protein